MKTEKTQKNKINKRIEQSNEITKKKTRRSKKIKNALTNFKVFYQNIRGLKSKVDSIMETISDYQPILICLVETHLQKEEEIRIPGYSQIFHNDIYYILLLYIITYIYYITGSKQKIKYQSSGN